MILFHSSGLESERVRLADFKVSKDPGRALVTGWLGAGVGIAAYDPVVGVAGLTHAPFPDSSRQAGSRLRPALFVDTGLRELFQAMARLGADEQRLVISVAGGARLISRSTPAAPHHEVFDAAIRFLAQRHLNPQAQHRSGLGDCRCSLEVVPGEVRLKACGQDGATVLWKNSTGS